MIILTEVGDTPQSVAHRMLGSNDESYAKKIWDINYSSFARQVNNNNGTFAPFRPLWLPDLSIREEDDPFWVEQILHRLEFIPSSGRRNLLRLQKSGLDINYLVGVGKSVRYSNRVNQPEGRDILESVNTSFAAQASVESFHRAVERAAHPAEKFAESVRELNGHLAKVVELREAGATAAGPVQGEVIQARVREARMALEQSAQKVKQTLDGSAKLYRKRVQRKTLKMLDDPRYLESPARKKIILIDSMDDVRMVSRIARYGKWMGRGCFGFSALLGVDEVYHTYEDGGDAFKKTVGVGLELGIVFALGELALLANPAGWVVLAGLAIAEGIGFTYAGDKIEKSGEWLAGQAEAGYAWLKERLKIWL